MSHRAIFLDRDGALIREVGYLTRPEQIVILPGVPEALAQLRRLGFLCIIVTNQSAVARGMMSLAELENVHSELTRQLPHAIDAIYFSPHATEHPDRKPNPGMLRRAARDFDIALSQSWMIGDTPRDVQAGRAAGCHGTILLRSGMPIPDPLPVTPSAVCDDLGEAARWILDQDSAARIAS